MFCQDLRQFLTAREGVQGADVAVHEDCDIRADRDTIMTDDRNSMDSNLQDLDDPGLDRKFSCDPSPASLNASEDKPLCTAEPIHIFETVVFHGRVRVTPRRGITVRERV